MHVWMHYISERLSNAYYNIASRAIPDHNKAQADMYLHFYLMQM